MQAELLAGSDEQCLCYHLAAELRVGEHNWRLRAVQQRLLFGERTMLGSRRKLLELRDKYKHVSTVRKRLLLREHREHLPAGQHSKLRDLHYQHQHVHRLLIAVHFGVV